MRGSKTWDKNSEQRQGCFEKVQPNPHSTEKKDSSVINISTNHFLQMVAVKMKYETIILKMKHKC